MKKIIAVVGPTATGKTNLAVSLCQKFNGEVISVDSRQIYRGMEVGTGREIQNSELGGKSEKTPIHLYGIIGPDQRLNAYDYARLVGQKIREVGSRSRTAFLVGGTGFYFDVILGRRKLSGVETNPELRKELEGLSKKELIEKLRWLNPGRLQTIDLNNGLRLIRAVEIASEAVDPKTQITNKIGSPPDLTTWKVLIIGLTAYSQELYRKADERINLMVQSGLLDEVRRISEEFGWQAPGMSSLGYRELRPYFEGTIQLEEVVAKIKFNTHAYIRRQKTYFKKYFADAAWFDVTEVGFDERVSSKVELFLR